MLGCDVDFPKSRLRNDALLFSESQGRILVSVNPSKQEAFERIMKDVPHVQLGTVRADKVFRISVDGKEVVNSNVDELLVSYRAKFQGF